MTSSVQRRVRITGIVLGVIPLSTIPLYIIFQDAFAPIPGVIMLVAMTSIWFVPVAIVLGCIDLGMAIASRVEIRVKKKPVR
jgi:hypothetical protein